MSNVVPSAATRQGCLAELLRLLEHRQRWLMVVLGAPLIERRFPEIAAQIPDFDRILEAWPRMMAGVVGRQWRLFDPAVRAALRNYAQRAGISPHDAKLEAVMLALFDPPGHLPSVAGVPQAVMRRAEEAVLAQAKADAPEELTVRLREDLHDVPLPDRGAAPASHPPDPTPQLAKLSRAERAYARHVLDKPGLSDTERDRDLGQRPGYSKKLRARVEKRLSAGGA